MGREKPQEYRGRPSPQGGSGGCGKAGWVRERPAEKGMAGTRALQGQRWGGGCSGKAASVRGKASRSGGTARAGTGQGIELEGRKVWKRGKGLSEWQREERPEEERGVADSMREQGTARRWGRSRSRGHPGVQQVLSVGSRAQDGGDMESGERA